MKRLFGFSGQDEHPADAGDQTYDDEGLRIQGTPVFDRNSDRMKPAVRSRQIIPVGEESEETPEEIWHLIIVPVSRLHSASLRALAYAASFTLPICAVHLAPDEDEAERFR